MKTVRFLASAFLVCGPLAAHAQGNSLLSAPYQIAVSGGGVLPEDLRQLSPGPMARLAFGIPLRPGAYVDVNAFGMNLSGEDGRGRESTLGGGLDLRLERVSDRVNFLFLAGGGYSVAKREGSHVTAPYANIGWGISHDLVAGLSMRYELRGLARFDQGFISGRGVTYDALATVGLVYSFGGSAPPLARTEAPETPPPLVVRSFTPAAPPAVAPVLAPEPSRVVPRVFDPADPCPAPAITAVVDAEGCLTAQQLVLPRAQFFETLQSVQIRPTGDAVLAALAASLVKHPGLSVSFSVHTDSEGYADDNLAATERLAKALSKRLFDLGAPPDRVEAVGMGERKPRASEDSDAGIEKNRRVEIQISGH